MNKMDKIRGKIKENRKTYKECADILNISTTAFQNKMNTTSVFNVTEAKLLSDYLNLTHDERIDIFMS